MLIKNLVNKDISTLLNCESEPIHIPGSIQPYGFLLGVTAKDYLIDYCSENCGPYLDCSFKDVLGKKLEYFFDAEQMEKFKEYCVESFANAIPFVFEIKEKKFNTTVHNNDGILVLEFEPFANEESVQQNLYLQSKKFAAVVEKAENLEAICQYIAKETQKITGYERVMVYKFDEEYNGEVFAESILQGMEPWLGLHYPHTDIPPQARALYLKNLMRMIVDASYVPVPLYTTEDPKLPNKTLNLESSVLRSVSPIHIEYMKNMGTAATLTVSLVHNNKLWGLISCHHSLPKNIPYHMRLAVQMQGHLLTSQIDVRQVADEYGLNQTAEQHLKTLLKRLSTEKGFLENPNNDLFLKPVSADGVIIVNNSKLYRSGNVPSNKDLHLLFQWLASHQPSGIYCTSKLTEDYPAAVAFQDKAAGIMYYSMGISVEQCIIWFRKETVITIDWAGNPDKAVVKNEGQHRPQPRKSFEKWQQQKGLQSLIWNKIEIQTAEKIALALERQIHIAYLQQQEVNNTSLRETLQSANANFVNINWISILDLKEPLLQIQDLSALILDNEEKGLPDNVKSMVGHLQESARKMHFLIEDLLEHSDKSSSRDSFSLVSLKEILAEIKLDLVEDMKDMDFDLHIGSMPVIHGIEFQIKQLFIYILDNAIKFSREEVGVIIDVDCKKINGFTLLSTNATIEGEYHCISITDNGIGFGAENNSMMFQFFPNLNPEEYTKTGMGLAICKKIMDNHNGYIDAEGIEGSSATFKLYFPVFMAL